MNKVHNNKNKNNASGWCRAFLCFRRKTLTLLVVLAVALILLPCATLADTETYQKGDGKGTTSETDDSTIASGSSNMGGDLDLLVDDAPHSVIKFPNIFGSGANQIPLGSTINSATLTLECFDEGDDVLVYQLIESWTETDVTWTSRTSSLSWTNAGADGTGSRYATTVATISAGTTGSKIATVTATVQNWSDGEANEGWLLADTGSGGVDFRSSEYGTASVRPKLTVDFTPPATNIGDGTSPADKSVDPSSTNNAVDAFTLFTNTGTDTVTALTVTFTGTDVNEVAASGVKIYEDNGGTSNEWDATDTLIDTASFSGTTASFTGLSISVDTSPTQYLVTYDIVAGATSCYTFKGAITAGTAVTYPVVNNDTTDATLTVSGCTNYDQTYTLDSLVAAEADWDFVGPNLNNLQVGDTDGAWCWTNTGSVSSGTGPPSGVACVYTETSSPVTAGDEFFMTLTNPVDAGSYALSVTFDRCTYGVAEAHLYFEAWDGSGWVPVDDWAGDSTTTFTSEGPYDFTSYFNSDFKIRFRTVVGGSTYQNDMSVDTIRIYGSGRPATTIIEDGTSPSNKTVEPSTANNAVNAFTLRTNTGIDTVTAITVTFTGTDVNDVASSGVKIYEDNGGTANEWDATDTLKGTASFSGSTADVSVSISVDTSPTQYLVTYDTAAGATDTNTLQGAITAATMTNALFNNDTTDATLTIMVPVTTIGDGTSPSNKTEEPSTTNHAVDAFTLFTNTGTDTVTALTVTFSGTDVNDVAASGVKIYEDNGGTANEWDATDTLKGTASFSGTTADVTVSISVDTSPTQYLVTYDIAAGAGDTNTLQGAITAATTTDTLVNNDTTDATLTVMVPVTTIGDGTSPSNKTEEPSTTNHAVDAFTLVTNIGTDTVTAITVTFSGTDVNDVAASGVKIYEDNGGTANEWDATDTLIDTVSFSGTTANFTGLNISVDTSANQYLVTYDTAAGAGDTNTLQGAVTAATTTDTLVNNDTTDATLTIMVPVTTIGDGTSPASKNVEQNDTNIAVDAFTLATNIGTDTVTALTVTFTGTDVNDVATSGVKIYEDNGGTANEWDATDTLIDTVSFSGTTASFTGLNISVDTSANQYLVTYDIAAGATFTNTLQGAITAATTTDTLVNNDTIDATLTVVDPTTTIGDGTSPASKDVAPDSTNNAVDAFTLVTNVGIDTVTALTVTFTGTDVSDVAASGVKIYEDDGGTANEWDATDTLIDTVSFSGTTASFTGLNISVNDSATQYLVTYDIVSAPTHTNTLQGVITAATVTDTLVNNDTTDATLTVDTSYDETYGLDTKAGAEADWDFVGPQGTLLQDRGTDGYWAWSATDTPSSNVGPTAPQGGSAGYVYTETSAPTVVDDEFTMTLSQGVNGSTHALNCSFYRSMDFDGVAGELHFEVWDGDSWENEGTWYGGTDPSWIFANIDLSAYYNSDVKVRFRTVVKGTNYYNDCGIDTVRIYGDERPPTTVIGDGTSPANKDVEPSTTNNAVNAFTLFTNIGTDTVTALTVTFTGTDVNDVASSGVKIYEDNGGTANEWDATDTLKGTASFSGTTADVTVSIAVDTSATQYLVTYDTAAGATATDTLQGAITAATVTNTLDNYDTADATLTVIIPVTTIGDGASPASKNVEPSTTNHAVDAFTLSTNYGADTVTDLTVTFTGTDVNDVAASGVKIYEDNGGTANEWDATDTLKGTASFSGTTASFTGINISVDSSATQYLVTYDTAAGATDTNTLQGAITAANTTNNLVNNDTTDATLTVVVPVTTIGDGTSPANKNVEPSTTNSAVDAFTLVTNIGTDTVTAIAVTFSGTDVNDVAASGVKIYEDNGGTPNEWDATDTLKGTASFSGTTADVTVSISVDTSATQYLVTYDIAAGATDTNTMQGAITAATTTDTLVNNDTTDATLTVVVAATTIGDGTSPGSKNVEPSSTNNAVNAFTLATNVGTDTVTALTVTFTGTDVNDVAASGVKIYEDNGGTANEWDATDTLKGTASFSGTTADVTVSISVDTSATQYLVTYDIAAGATDTNTMQGAITAATTTDPLVNNDTTDATLTVVVPVTTIGDGSSPSNKTVDPGSTNNAVNAFTLATNVGTDTVTALTVTFTGTDVNDVAASGVKIYEDNGTTADEWDASDTLKGTASFSGTTADVTVSISVDTSATQYLVTYDIAAGASSWYTLQGAITAATATDTVVNNDTTDATLTVSSGGDIQISTGRFTLNTGTGTQQITGVGFQPKAYILFYIKNATDDADSTAGETLLSIGMTDGTNQFCMASGTEDNQTSGDVGRRGFSDRVLASHDGQASQTVDGEASHASMIADGFTININDDFADPASPLIHYIAFGGGDLSVDVGMVDLANTMDDFVDVTAPGFEADVVIASYIGVFLDALGDGSNDRHSFSLGWAVNPDRQASGNQFSMSVGAQDGGVTSTSRSRFDNVRAGTSHYNDLTDAAFEIGSFDASGFNVTTRLAPAITNEIMGYMALKLGASNPYVYTVARPARTSAGNDVESNAGFEPMFLMGIGSALLTTANSGTDGGSIAIGITDGTDTYAISQFDQDNVTPTNTHSRVTSTQFMSANLHSGEIDWEATFSSFNSDGWTINYGDAAGLAYQNAFLAIGADDSTATTIGDGSSPASKDVSPGSTNNAVDAFTLATSSDTDTVSALTVTFTGTDVNDVAASGVKIYEDNGTTADEWDASDTLKGTASFSGTTADVTVSIPVDTSATQYLVTYDIAAGATYLNTLQGAITAATVTNTLVNNDTTDATLTVSVPTTIIGDGGSPANKDVEPSSTSNAVNSFTLVTGTGTDTVTALTVTFTGTDVSDVAESGVKIYEDNGGTANEWDATDTLIDTSSFSGSTASFTGLNISVDTSETQYLVTYDIAAGATDTNILQGAITAASTTNTLVNNDTVDATLTVVVPATTVGDGTSPANKNVGLSSTNKAVNAFTLVTNMGTDTVTALTVTFTGTDVNDVAASGVKIYEDNGGTANEWDATDTLIDTVSFSGTTASFTGLNISVNTSPTQYLVTYDIAAGATLTNTLQGAITAGTSTTNTLVNSDTTDATLTIVDCDYSSWRQIAIDNTKVIGTADHTNFPLLVSLSGDWLKTTTVDTTNGRITNDSGYDIIFKDTSGTQLDHEIEDYDGTNGTLVAWVRIPTLSYNTNTVIYMYYGNDCISSSQENINGVWDANYVGVWHLSETPDTDGGTDEILDSNNNNPGDSQNMAANDQVPGRIDGSLDFDGGNDYLDLDSHISDYASLAVGSISLWFSYTDTSDYKIMFSASCNTDDNSDLDIMYYQPDDVFMAGIREDSTNVWNCAFPANYADGNWHHYVMTVDGSGNKHYIDGGQITGDYTYGGSASTQAFFNSVTGLNTLRFGNREDFGGNQYHFGGNLDEVRILSNALTLDWIQTEHNNQSDPSTFYSVGEEGAGCSYSHKRKVTIQNSQVIGTADHDNFPVLVNLTDTALRHIDSGGHVTNSNGYDIVFRASDETAQLDHEIEEYDGTAGTVVAWVRVPTLDYNDDTVIYMYYGNNCISTSQENVAGVWDSDYKMVQHMIDATSSTIVDSTSNNIEGTKGSASNPDEIDGQISKAQDFDTDIEYIQFEDHSLFTWTPVDEPRTLSFWFKATSLPTVDDFLHFLQSETDAVGNHYQWLMAYDGADYGLGCRISDNNWDSLGTFYILWEPTLNTWYHVAMVASTAGNNKIYIDGVSQSVSEMDVWDDNSAIDPETPAIKANGGESTGQGVIDEFRYSHAVRSAGWIQTGFNNQNTPSSFYVDNGEETAGTVTLSNHTAGQEPDNFGAQTSISGAELFAFKLTNTTDSDVTVKKVLFPLSVVTGILQGDFSNLYIYIDTDNDGNIEPGETTTVGGLGAANAGVTDITFSEDFTIAANTALNYILVGDMNYMQEDDTVTIDLNPVNVTITAGHVTGTAPTSATHTTDTQCIFYYRRPITIQASQVMGSQDHDNFPIVVSLSGTWLRTSTDDPANGHIENANGHDIIFRAADGKNQLDHEIEYYDGSATGGTLVAWVRIPTLDFDDNTVIYMYYGNSCIDTSTQNVAGVWNTNYVGVWHWSNDSFLDSTQNDSDGTNVGTTSTTGILADGRSFDGADRIDHSTAYDQLDPAELTFSVWATFAADVNNSGGAAILQRNCGSAKEIGYRMWLDDGATNDFIYGGVASTTSAEVDVSHTLISTDRNWNMWTIVFEQAGGGTLRFYRNGIQVSSSTGIGTTLYYRNSFGDDRLVFGWGEYGPDYYTGTLDEARISNTPRPAEWLLTEYNNQNDPSTFYIVGNEEEPAPTAVDLISFTATGQDENVLVEWETAQEVDNLGFNLYRSTELGGTYSKLNSNLIPGLLSSVTGQQYTYVDKDVTRSVLYYYMLEDLDLDGTRTMHGPICVDWDGDGQPDDYIVDPDDDTDTGEEDPDVSIPDTQFEELESDLSDWTPSNIGGSASWVKMASFKAYEQDDGVALEWETSYEIDNLGFHIYRETDGKSYRITPDLVPGSVFSVGEGSELPAGQSYAYWDALTKQTGRESYWLDSIELNGGRASFGPIETEISGKPIPRGRKARFKSIADYQVSKARARVKVKALRDELSVAPIRARKSGAIFYEVVPDNKPSGPRLPPSEEQWALSAQPGVKIYVKEDGWYRVGEPELVAAGLRPGMDPRYLQLYTGGVEQSIIVRGDEDGRFDLVDAVEFYGEGLDTPFTDARVYWLVVGSRPGRRLDTPFNDLRIGPDKGMRVPRGLRGRGAPLSFPYTVELKEQTFYFAALKTFERDNFFGSVISTDPVDQLLAVAHPAPSSPAEAMLEIWLQGATEVLHQIKIFFNYAEVGEVFFGEQDQCRARIPISQESLLEGDNVVTLVAQGGSMDVSLVDYVKITYWRTYTADEDAMEFKAQGGEWVSIGGFSTPEIRVVDITDSVRMLNVRGKVKPDGSDYAVTIKVPRSGERTLLAFTEENIKQPARISANIASSWHELNQGAYVIIIGHRDLLESVRLLKELREQQGLSVVLVDVEDLYDEFNFGSKSPWAVKDFLAQAYQYWNPQPRYLILVGDTSYDPRNYLGYGEFDLMPTKLVNTEKLKTASDDWFVDFDDDELPEMAVGRLPAASAAEATAMVAKIIDYEGYASLMNEVLLVSDTNDFYNFELANAKVAKLIPGNMAVSEIYRGRSATARTELLNLLNQGQLLVNYFGHGSTQIWNGNLLTYSDVWNLTNYPNLPFFVSTTCLNGFFQDPYSESLAEGLLKAPLGGAIAVWTSSGLTDPEEQVPLNEELIKLLFNGQGLTIGEAVMRAKQATTDSDIRRTWILFGDPTLRLR